MKKMMVSEFKIFSKYINNLSNEIYINSIITTEYNKNELFGDESFKLNIFNKNIRIFSVTIDIKIRYKKFYWFSHTFNINELIEYLEDNLIWIYIDSLYKHYFDYINDITNKDILEYVIINYINQKNFSDFFDSLPLIYQEEFRYLINANKFDLI